MQSLQGELLAEEFVAVMIYENNAWGSDEQRKCGKHATVTLPVVDVAKLCNVS